MLRAVVRTAFYLGTGTLGFGLFALLVRSGLLAQVDILFYRGIALLALAFAITWAGAAWLARRLAGRRPFAQDGLSASALSLAFNLSFFVLLPVTIDRSVSVFMLGEMAAHPAESYSAQTMRDAFERRYLGEYRQIERRLAEQVASGNVERVGGGYRLTSQGEAFIRSSRSIGRLFGTDTRFVDLRPAEAGPPP
ncbi:hypothetical protein [uncultured Enterovirga sp.]|uniref:hypothetical protein n=1 Tax=uncultured Enterovirga sp. TaxID=2026352 RepID=UPI0035CADD0D